MIKHALLGFGGLIFALNGGSLRADDEFEAPPLVLLQGEQRLLKFNGIARFAVGSPAARAIRLQTAGADALLIKGVAPGTADLAVWKNDGRYEHRLLRVEPEGPEIRRWLTADLSRLLSPLREAQVLIGADAVFLRGTIDTIEEARRVGNLTRAFSAVVRDETACGPTLAPLIQTRLEAWLTQAKLRATLQAENRSGRWVLAGGLENPADLTRVQNAARQIFPPIEFEIESLPDLARTVHFKVLLLEMRRSQARTLGFAIPEDTEARGATFRLTTSTLQSALDWEVALRARESEGSLRVLSEPELVVRSPGEAELFSGGEIPLEQRTHFYSNIQWKPVGLSLKLKVTQATATRVRLEVATETSHLDASLATDKTPGLRSNRLKTQVDATFGTPLLLSGLIQQEFRVADQGLPWLRSLPLLGSLFGQADSSVGRTELAAVLIPSREVPAEAARRVRSHGPTGPAPWPREWISPANAQDLRAAPDYPWNVLGTTREEDTP